MKASSPSIQFVLDAVAVHQTQVQLTSSESQQKLRGLQFFPISLCLLGEFTRRGEAKIAQAPALLMQQALIMLLV